MGFTEILLTAAGLSMDAFSAAVCKGTAAKGKVILKALVIALMFGSFQAVMPLIGFMIGNSIFNV